MSWIPEMNAAILPGQHRLANMSDIHAKALRDQIRRRFAMIRGFVMVFFPR